MNNKLWMLCKEQAYESYIDINDHFSKKFGWHIDKLQSILDKHNVTLDEFIDYSKQKDRETPGDKIFVLIERTENDIALRHYSTKKESLLTFAKNNTDLTDSEFNKLKNDGVFDDDEYMIYIDTVTKL